MSGKKKKEGEFECDQCSKSFTDSRYLRKHIVRMHDNTKKREPVGKLTCGVCGKDFPRLSHLTRHQVVHFNVRDWSCPFCSLSFMQKAHLISHMGRKHRNERVADVEEEMEKVRGREDEIVHGPAVDPSSIPSTSHSSPRLITDQLHIPIIICALCGANFFVNSELKRHKETNHVVRRCLRCGMNVNGRSEMKEHMRKKHNSLSSSSPSSSSFTCIHCSLQFAQRTQFDRHFLSRHFTISRCEYCREELGSPIERRDHMRDEHEEIRCGYCNELMNNEDALVKHVYATHWNRTERIKTRKKKSPRKKLTIDEEEEKEIEEEREEIGEVEKEKEVENEKDEEEREINISILVKLPLKENGDTDRNVQGWTNLPLGKDLPSDITNLYPQLKTLHVYLPRSLSSSHSLLLALPIPFDESINEWTERTVEIDLRNTVID